MKKYIIIVCDTNDADYISQKSEITDEEIELIKPVIEAIVKLNGANKGSYRHNYETGELVSDRKAENLYGHLEGFKLFNSFVPKGDYNYPGVHTIKSIEILVVSEEIKLL